MKVILSTIALCALFDIGAARECACTFTGWQHYAEGEGNTGTAYTVDSVGSWVNVQSNTISSLRVDGPCDLRVSTANDGAAPLSHVYTEGTYNYPIATGNDNINSVILECEETTMEPSAMPTTEPTRDCDLLHIDEFLLDCSTEWANAGNVMEVVYNATAANSQSIVQIADSVADATASISTNANNIVTATSSATTNAADITALQNKVEVLEDMLDRMSVHSAANAAAPMTYAHAGAWNVDEPAGMGDGAWNGVTVTGKDLGIVVLAVINIVMIAMMVIACRRSGGRTKYHPVAVGSDMEPINA